MRVLFKLNLKRIILFSLSIYFFFFTFYNLNWGAPFYFHPDERNIASSVSQLSFPTNLNPHFFAYGSFPIYLIYLIGLIANLLFRIPTSQVSFETAIFVGRLISAFLTLALVFLIFKSAQKFGQKTAVFSFIMSLTSVALFQFSHFVTFEIWLTLFTLLAFYFAVKYVEDEKDKYFIIVCLLVGFLTSLKLSSIMLLIVPTFLIIRSIRMKFKPKKNIKLFFILLVIPVLSYLIASPFNVIDYKSFLSSMRYEGGVASGTLPVFYSGSFINTFPVIFQFHKILPFLINPFLTILLIPSFFYLAVRSAKNHDPKIIILFLTTVVVFFSGSFLFVKWTRYIVPAVPFIYITIAIFLEKYFGKREIFVISSLAIIGLIFSFSFIKTVRIDGDSRIKADEFAKKNLKENSRVLSEVYDLGIIPFNNSLSNITLFNFYDLDSNRLKASELSDIIPETDYIILPSQRLYHSRTENSTHFPAGYKFYKDLFDGKLGFKKIYQTPCDFFCKMTYSFDPIFNLEETASVFDRPTVFIFKKNEN